MAAPILAEIQQTKIADKNLDDKASNFPSAAKAVTKSPILKDAQGEYIIVTVRKPDGTTARVKRRVTSPAAGDFSKTIPPASSAPVSSTSVSPVTSNVTISRTNAAPSKVVTPSGVKAAIDQPKVINSVAGVPRTTATPVTSPISKPLIPAPLPATSARPNATKRLLRSVGGHVSRTAAAFSPGWDIGDMQDGDEYLDDDSDDFDSDGRYDSDDYGDDDRDDDRDHRNNEGSSAVDQKDDNTSSKRDSNEGKRIYQRL
jgi:hypothetical protein